MRWHFKWGLTVQGKDGPVEITDYEYAQHFGDPLPEDPEIPEAGIQAWLYFWKLNRRRQPAFDGVAPLTYEEIRSWSELTRTFITPEEVEYIITIDDAFLSGVSEGRERHRRRKESREKAKKRLGK